MASGLLPAKPSQWRTPSSRASGEAIQQLATVKSKAVKPNFWIASDKVLAKTLGGSVFTERNIPDGMF